MAQRSAYAGRLSMKSGMVLAWRALLFSKKNNKPFSIAPGVAVCQAGVEMVNIGDLGGRDRQHQWRRQGSKRMGIRTAAA